MKYLSRPGILIEDFFTEATKFPNTSRGSSLGNESITFLGVTNSSINFFTATSIFEGLFRSSSLRYSSGQSLNIYLFKKALRWKNLSVALPSLWPNQVSKKLSTVRLGYRSAAFRLIDGLKQITATAKSNS